MKTKSKFFSIIIIGLMLTGAQVFVANNSKADDELAVSDSSSSLTAVDREDMAMTLAEYWADESEEPFENLVQMFSQASMDQLISIAEASSFADVLDRLGDLDRDYVFTPVNPCKILDTRFGGGGVFFPNQQRSYSVFGNLGGQGGSNCPSPRGEPRAVHLSIGTFDAQGTGNIQAYPFGAGPGAGISENFASFAQSGINFINTGPVKTCFGCGPDITVTARFAQTHILAFVLGYYHEVDRNDADRLALAYGFVEGQGPAAPTFRSRTENVSSVTWNGPSGWFEISISGENYFFDRYTSVVTPSQGTCPDVVTSITSGSGRMFVQFRDAVPAGEGNIRRCRFQFVTFKDQ
jgi:hypothetical protein